jgi:hypothetical protein
MDFAHQSADQPLNMTTEMRGERRAKLQGNLMFPAAAFERLAVELLRIV